MAYLRILYLIDRGPQFTSRVWSAFFKHLNINVSLTSGYHPHSNGQTERMNQELTCFLSAYVMPTCLVECKESPTVYRYSTRNRLIRTQSYTTTLSRSEGLVQQGIFYFLLSLRNWPLNFIGPFKIFWKINPVSYWLLQPRSMRIPPIFHIMSLVPLSPIPTPCARHRQSHDSLASGLPTALWKSQASLPLLLPKLW